MPSDSERLAALRQAVEQASGFVAIAVADLRWLLEHTDLPAEPHREPTRLPEEEPE